MRSLAADSLDRSSRSPRFRRAFLSTGALLLSHAAAAAAPVATTASAEEFREPVVAGNWGGCDPDEIGPFGSCFGSDEPGELRQPVAIAVDDSGFVYVAEPGIGRTQKFTADGALVEVWAAGAPADMKWGPGDVLWVVVGSTVRKWDRHGNDVGGWGQAGSGPGEFLAPRALDFDADGHVLVLDAGNNRVQRFTQGGDYLGEWVVTPYWPIVDRLSMVVLPDNSVLVSDAYTPFERFDADGTFLGKWAPKGRGRGEFRRPSAMSLGPDGNVYVVDADNARIQVMTPEGRYLGQWGEHGNGSGELLLARDIAIHDRFLYVTDLGSSAVRAYSFRTVVATDPPSLPLRVDGVETVSPVVVDWAPGTRHEIETVALDEADGRRCEFAAWNDGGSLAHTVTAPGKPAAYTAAFDESFWMEMSAEPGVTFTPGSGWVPADEPVEIHATAPPGYAAHWVGTGRGSYTGPFGGALVRAREPVTQHAVLETSGSLLTLTISAGDAEPYVWTDAPRLAPVSPFTLAASHPNPFRDRTSFLYTLPGPADVRISVFDVTGRLVRRLDEGPRPGGTHTLAWDGRGGDSSPAPAGVYFVRLEADGRAATRKVTRLGLR